MIYLSQFFIIIIIRPLFNYGTEEEMPDEDLLEMEASESEDVEEMED